MNKQSCTCNIKWDHSQPNLISQKPTCHPEFFIFLLSQKQLWKSPVCSTTKIDLESVTSLSLLSSSFLVSNSKSELLQEPCNCISPFYRCPHSTHPSLIRISHLKTYIGSHHPVLNALQWLPIALQMNPSSAHGLQGPVWQWPLPIFPVTFLSTSSCSPALPKLLLFFNLRSFLPQALHILPSLFWYQIKRHFFKEHFSEHLL